LTVVHGRVRRIPFADQLVRLVHVDMVLVAVKAFVVPLRPARVLVLLCILGQLLRASSRPGRISAKAAPPSPPIATGKLTLTASAHGSTLRWEKLAVAESAPIRTGTRLVALAEIGSSPIIIRMGKDTAEPDDAAVLRKPQASPAPTPSTKDQTSYSNQLGIISPS